MTVIIAEVGTHHMGDMRLGRRLIDLARENGADMVKFQLFDTEKLTHWPTPAIKEEAKKCELTFEQSAILFRYGQETGIEVFFSVFDTVRVDWCETVGVKKYKIAANMRDKATLDAVFHTGKPVIISSSELREEALKYTPNPLYCPPGYPQPAYPMPDFMWWAGLSDHSIGIDTAKIAIARGAQMVEKHFSLTYKIGMDGAWSMTPDDLRELRRWADLVQSYRQD